MALAGLGTLLAVTVLPAVAVAQETPDGSDRLEVRVAAQRHDDGSTEFAMQLRAPGDTWTERILPIARVLPVGAEVGRWFPSTSVAVTADPTGSGPGASWEVRILVQALANGRIEFAVQHRSPGGAWSERLLPDQRFLRADLEPGRWLASSPVDLVITAPEPATERPEPATERPEPATERPEPATDRPEPATDRPPRPTAADDDPPGAVEVSDDLPDFDMIDVHTGEAVKLHSVVTGETPLLFWLWSPY